MSRTISVQELKKKIGSGKELLLLDVRRKTDRDADPVALPGAIWRDPEKVESWTSELKGDMDIVLYCARGGSISNNVLDKLVAGGIRARFVEGGIAAWKQSGGRLEEPQRS